MWQHGSILPFTKGSDWWWWWCDGEGIILVLAPCLNSTTYLSIVADPVHPFMTTMYCLVATSSRITHYVTKLKSSQTDFLNMTITVTRFQSSRAVLGCGHEQPTAAWCYHVNMDLNLWGKFPAPCWICVMKNWSSSKGKRGATPILTRWI